MHFVCISQLNERFEQNQYNSVCHSVENSGIAADFNLVLSTQMYGVAHRRVAYTNLEYFKCYITPTTIFVL